MRKLSFLFLSCIAMFALSSCGKELIEPSQPNTENLYSVIHSEWTGIETLGWADGTTYTVPTQEANWSVPLLTRGLLDSGSTVLVFAKSKDTDEVKPVPVEYVSGPTDNVVDSYGAQTQEGNLLFTHTKTVDGNPEAPTDLNNVNLRYIIITENTSPFGRTAVTDFKTMSYKDVVKHLNIPE